VDDLQKGIIDRFRSLPMSPSAVLIGRTSSDVIADVTSLVVMTAVALIVGWRVHTSPQEALLGFLLLLLFAYALSWVMAVVALVIRTPEAYNSVAWIVIVPLSFLANTFVDSTRLHGPAEGRRRMEPRLGGHPGRARALRQHPPGHGRLRRLAAAAPGGGVAALDRADPGRVRAPGDVAPQEGRQPLTDPPAGLVAEDGAVPPRRSY
jgi:ABC-2 type transporter